MSRPALIAVVALALPVLTGCGVSPSPPPTSSAPPTPPPAVQTVEKEPPPKPAPRPAKRERPPAEKAKVAQLFQVPQVTRPNAGNYTNARQEASTTPHIRLIGFSRLDGQLRALVQVKNETLPVEQGDIVDGVEIVSINEEGVSFQHAGQRWTSYLIEKVESRPVTVARAPAPSPVDLGSPAAPAADTSPSSSN